MKRYFQSALRQREQAYQRVEEAKATAVYMDNKVKHYQNILEGFTPDDTTPGRWGMDDSPKHHEC